VALAPNKALPDKKEDARFIPGAAASYPSHQTSEKVTIGVKAYFDDEETRPIFGKKNPYNYGVMPVLVVIQNDSSKTIRLQPLQVVWVAPDRDRIEATPAKDVRYLTAPRRPAVPGTQAPIPKALGHKNPLDTWGIEGRAFTAPMLPPGQSASGFFYFQTGFQHGATVYISGLREAESGKELLYFEVPVQ